MASVFDYLFNRKDKLSPYFIPQEAAPPPVPLEPVLGEGQMAVLSSGEARRRLRLAAQESIRGKNRYQREIDFGRAASADSSGQGLLFMENPAVRATLKSMFERHCRESGLEKAEAFDELFELPAQDKGRRMARVLSGLLRQFEDQKVPRIEYTDAESLGGGVPQLLSQGFEAMVLAKTVQGSLRDQVNTWISLETGEEKSQVQARWRHLDVLAGARNAALDICTYFSTEDFEQGRLTKGGDPDLRRLLVNCVSSLCYVNDPSYRELVEKPLSQVTDVQTSYARRGGDYRAFHDVADEMLCGFLRGEAAGLPVRHRPDYLAAKEAVLREQAQKKEAARTKVSARQLEEQEFGKDCERSRANEFYQKGSSLYAGRAGVRDDTGKHNRHDSGERSRHDGGRRL